MASTEAKASQVRPHSRLAYLPALDGLRAFAVAGVLLYHAELPWFQGGFLGVDVFFVISGYLITSLLLGEWNETQKVNLGAFWLRRARRLLPALYLLLASVLVFSVLSLRDEVARLRSDGVAAFGYVTNWYLIFNEQSYFETMGRPSLFQHLWSLAVEEQFYLLWPMLFALIMKFARRLALPIVIAGVIVSTLLMAALHSPILDPSRVYYGTDTRAAGLLVGVVLAFVLSRNVSRGTGRLWSDIVSRDVLGSAALLAIMLFFVLARESEPFLYQGGFLVLEIAVATLIAAIALSGGRILAPLLGSSVPRWIGLRSYGIYLWHWPVFMVTRPQIDVELEGLVLLGMRIGLTLALAELSYRYVETPIRNGAIQRVWQDLRTAQGRRQRFAHLRWLVVSTTVLSVTVGPSIVAAQPPAPPDYLLFQQVNTVDADTGGEELAAGVSSDNMMPNLRLEEPSATPDLPTPTKMAPTATAVLEPTPEPTATPHPTFTPEPTATPSLTATPTDEPTATTTPSPTPTPILVLLYTPAVRPTKILPFDPTHTTMPLTEVATAEVTPTKEALPVETTGTGEIPAEPTATPSATPVPGDIPTLGKIVAVGDSVMLGAANELLRAIPNLAMDARVSRQASDAIGLLQSYKDNGKLDQVVLIHIGNNGYFTARHFDQIMSVLSDRKWVVFVNVRVPRKWEAPNNAVIVEGVIRYPNAVLVDWYAASADHHDYFAKDGFHLQVVGQKAFVGVIREKLMTLAGLSSTPTPTPSPTP